MSKRVNSNRGILLGNTIKRLMKNTMKIVLGNTAKIVSEYTVKLVLGNTVKIVLGTTINIVTDQQPRIPSIHLSTHPLTGHSLHTQSDHP